MNNLISGQAANPWIVDSMTGLLPRANNCSAVIAVDVGQLPGSCSAV
jgi:hypothetical protein